MAFDGAKRPKKKTILIPMHVRMHVMSKFKETLVAVKWKWLKVQLLSCIHIICSLELLLHFSLMTPVERFKRALVLLLLELARVYGLTLNLTRDSPEKLVSTSYRKVMLRAHPDKGGSEDDSKRLKDAWGKCNDAKKNS